MLIVFFLIMGTFMDALANMIILGPLLMPVAVQGLGMEPVPAVLDRCQRGPDELHPQEEDRRQIDGGDVAQKQQHNALQTRHLYSTHGLPDAVAAAGQEIHETQQGAKISSAEIGRHVEGP